MTITVGVVVHSDPGCFQLTLEALWRNTRTDVEVLILADGPDASTIAMLNAIDGLRQSRTPGAQGMAACFNRLFQETSSDLAVLVESGTLVGPGWLERLTGGLQQKPEYGLAGPSTNLCWNEQGAVRHAESTQASISSTTTKLLRDFRDSVRTLEPLYSLADFCYAVDRRVWEAIGPADSRYGLGPGWEMDYNIRAARAGFAGIWVCGAYAYRFPFSERRTRSESELFEQSKRLYQSKFCARQLESLQGAFYREHCRGDTCPNFAPAARPVTIAVTPSVRTPPLVTCIMPTFNRRNFIRRSLSLFQSQDYERRELVIVDDGSDSVEDLVPDDPAIRYIRMAARSTIGSKRNAACQHARGDIIVHWDDDDWYPPNRVSLQVKALLDAGADVCGTSTLHYFDPAGQRAFLFNYGGRGSVWVAGNTLAYKRSFWQTNPFLDLQIGEDARFLWRNPLPKVHDMRSAGLCIATLHDGNASPKRINTCYWTREPISKVLEIAPELAEAVRAQPLISCIMPTRNRRAFVASSLRYFAEQTWPSRELLVIDDGDDNVADLCDRVNGVRHMKLPRRMTIGEKRNFACRHAAGPIIAHWDDDDWYAPGRLEAQVAPLVQGTADITALESTYIYRVADGRCWTLSPELHRRMFVADVHGGTLVFFRSAWESGARYPAADLAEDALFLKRAMGIGQRVAKLQNPGLFVYVRHEANTWQFEAGSYLETHGWSPIEPPQGFAAR